MKAFQRSSSFALPFPHADISEGRVFPESECKSRAKLRNKQTTERLFSQKQRFFCVFRRFESQMWQKQADFAGFLRGLAVKTQAYAARPYLLYIYARTRAEKGRRKTATLRRKRE